MFQAIRLIAKEEGILALWKGNLTAELLYIVYGGVQFSVFHTYKSYFLNLQNGNQPLDKRAIELSPLYSFIGGALSSSTATVVSYPLDVLRTRFVSQGEPKVN